MSVAFDTLSTGGGSSGGHIYSGAGISGSTGATIASFQSPSLTASLLVIGICINDTSANIGTLTLVWDPSGVNKTMSQIGTISDNTNGVSIFFQGVVSPGTSGAKSLKFTWSGGGLGDSYEVFGISYTGSITTSVANATEGFASNTSTSNSATVTTAVSIPSTDMEVAFFSNSGGVAWSSTNNTNIDTDAAQISVTASRATGAGSTITSTGALASSALWLAMTVGIVAAPVGTGVPYNDYQNQPDLSPLIAQRRDFSGWTPYVDRRRRVRVPPRRLLTPDRRLVLPSRKLIRAA